MWPPAGINLRDFKKQVNGIKKYLGICEISSILQLP